ncbi:MAG TPA: potassium transporter TrkG [Steroidobacteraceae bacterium]|jgi:trk system potassium uptake protein TrkH|nr:potassium transporter TrkG [Steroidobacteraceae bacterium]
MLGIAHLLGLILAAFALAYILPIGCSLATGDGLWMQFLLAAAITAAVGAVLAAATFRYRRELKPRDGFLLVTLGWILLAASATLPLLLTLPGLSFTRAFFETMSGLTTTGSTVLDGLDSLAPSINFWRHSLIWLGGLAVIVVAVGVMPLLGVGGMQLSKAEAPGPVKEERLAPRVTETARSLWLVYALLTLSGALALRLCGMTWFDAICHAFSAVALGGFSTHDASIAYFHSAAVEFVLIVIMLISALNFARHFAALRRLSLKPYRHDPEVRTAAILVAASVVFIAGLLTWHGVYPTFGTALRYAAFNVVSLATTTGWATVGPAGFTTWPVFAPIWMLFLSGIVCNTGSSGGGIKMFRTLVLARQAGRELKLLVHPSAVAPLRVGGRPVTERAADAVLAFIFLYFMTVSLLTFAMLLTGMSFDWAFRVVVASINNTAFGLPGQTVWNLHSLTPLQTWICTAAMLLGRLEIFSVIVLFTRTYWRK